MLYDSHKFVENKFDTNYLPTLGVDITTKRIVVNNSPVKLILVDTAGQEFFGKLRPSYYRGASACSIFFDRNDRLSFQEVPNWIAEFAKYVPNPVPLALVGVTNESHEVSSEEGMQLAQELNCSYFECPSTNGPHVAKVFDSLNDVIEGHVKSRGAGEFKVPGLMKIKVNKKPATKARKNVPNPFRPGEFMDVASKPARKVVKVLPLKALKDMAAS